jgi:hypothetical protein
MITHLYYDLYQGGLGFCGLASVLELAHSAVHPANPWGFMAWPGASARAQILALLTPILRVSEKAVLEHFVIVGVGDGSHFMPLLQNAVHLTLQARYLHCSGCHFELKQVGCTAA